MDDRTTDPPGDDASARQPPVSRIGDDGKPVYDQEFFLALARCGKEVWNRWVSENRDIRVAFGEVDFCQVKNKISFAGFLFSDYTDFSASIFGAGADFSGAIFETHANFASATFGDSPNFIGAIFGNGANFSNTNIGTFAQFTGTCFGAMARFSDGKIGDYSQFVGAVFGGHANFTEAIFGRGCNFTGSVFGRIAIFHGATFGNPIHFSGATFGGFASFSKATFIGDADLMGFSAEKSDELKQRLINDFSELRTWPADQKRLVLDFEQGLKNESAGAHTFVDIFFLDAIFLGLANFSGRSFKPKCDLTGVRFCQPPLFDSDADFSSIELSGVKIGFETYFLLPAWAQPLTSDRPTSILRRGVFGTDVFEFKMSGWTSDSNVANRLRRLRDLADTANIHDLERDLYIEERKAERGIFLARYAGEGWRALFQPKLHSHCLWIAIMAAYWLLANYGRSFVRPLVALVISVPLFWWTYSAALIAPTHPAKLADFRRATWAFAISNAVPFVGALTLERDVRLTLLCGDRPIDLQQSKQMNDAPVCVPIPGRRFQLLALGQSIFSALCIFFAGLALRNYFKLR